MGAAWPVRRRAEIEKHAFLVAEHLGVVPGRDRDHLARSDLPNRSVVHVDTHPALQDIPEVEYLARVGPHHRLDVRRPPPAGLESVT
jgi:hypothetical protein